MRSGFAQPALTQGVTHYFDAALEIKLLHQIRFVGFDGLDTDSEISCYLFVGVSRGNQAEDFGFALGDLIAARLPSEPTVAEIATDDLPCQRGIQVNSTRRDHTDRFD